MKQQRITKSKILYELIVLELKSGATQMALAEKYNVAPRTINKIYIAWIQNQLSEMKQKQATITGVANIQGQ